MRRIDHFEQPSPRLGWVLMLAGLFAAAAVSAADSAGVAASGHWAYAPVRAVSPPDLDPGLAGGNPIDAFLEKDRRQGGLSENPLADERTLLRRATYDLTGLPPTPGQVQAFLSDPSPDAWGRVVDDLLASPHYGEKWGRHWLDAVRWAESNGYERDSTKHFMWKYRDYVIRAVNEDKPYDEFLIEQFAGDVLPEPTPESITATGFYRLGLHDDEPADEDQFYYDYYDDIINTISRSTLATGISCARCHDHKVDPISQREYYQFLGFIRNLEIPHRGAISEKMVYSTLSDEEAAALRERTEAARGEFVTSRLKQWEAVSTLEWIRRRAEGDPDLETAPSGNTYRYASEYWGRRVPDLDRVSFVGGGRLADGPIVVPPALTRAPGMDPTPSTYVLEGRIRARAAGTHRFDVRIGGAAWMHIDNRLVFAKTDENEITGTYSVNLPAGEHGFVAIVSDRRAPSLDINWIRPEAAAAVPIVVSRDWSAMQSEAAAAEAAAEAHPEWFARSRRQLDSARAGEERALSRYREVVAKQDASRVTAAREAAENRPTHILERGNPGAVGERVDPGFPRILDWPGRSGWDPDAGIPRRLAMARWIADPANPLTARVAVNRIWQHHFGRGLVRSADEFGGLGDTPTHPELLDWLAAEFIRLGWRAKPLHRLIMTSRAYRMSSEPNRLALQTDPLNDRFWRFDMRRLTSEEIRDSVLWVSGALNLDVGGPSVFPALPQEVLDTASNPHERWRLDAGPNHQNRRSLYTFVRRSLLDPQLAAFDMADTDLACPVRFHTTVPAQALAMLNSEFIDDHAYRLADRLRADPAASPKDLARKAFHLVLGRDATPEEIDVSTELIADLTEHFGHDRHDATARFGLMMLNLNEFIYLD